LKIDTDIAACRITLTSALRAVIVGVPGHWLRYACSYAAQYAPHIASSYSLSGLCGAGLLTEQVSKIIHESIALEWFRFFDSLAANFWLVPCIAPESLCNMQSIMQYAIHYTKLWNPQVSKKFALYMISK
jgi:hypothetical protein